MPQTLIIVGVVVWHYYRPSMFGILPDPNCPLCGQSLGHSTVLVVRDDKGDDHEIHSDCLR